MEWVAFVDRKPKTSGWHIWRGILGYGGYNYYNKETNSFDIVEYIPYNKYSIEELMWLDEKQENKCQ